MLTQLHFFNPAPPPIETNLLGIEGLELHRDFLSRQEQWQLMEALDERPWGRDYQRRYQHLVRPFPGFAHELIGKLLAARLLPSVPAHISVNDYSPGVGIGAHIDKGDLEQITIISLGWEYEMDFVHGLTGETRQFMMELGSVVIIKGPARWEWQHGIRGRLSDHGVLRGRRVSVTMRNTLPSMP